jgi:chemotaxis protein MotB
MARAGRLRRGSGDHGSFWPGYVDLLSTMLMVFIFLATLFMVSQFFASQEASGKDTVLRRLTRQIVELTNLLSLEKGKGKSTEDQLATLQATLFALREENARLGGTIRAGEDQVRGLTGDISKLTGDLKGEKELSARALSQIEALNLQLLEVRRQIAALNEALEASEQKSKDSDKTIKDLGARLNAALTRQVQELQRYRSDFFGRLRDLLKDRKDIRVVGDRFVFQSEVLFPLGQAQMTAEGLAALEPFAGAIIELERQIPPEINWVLQVDGHTDVRPISSPIFPSNWELSAARAASVVKYLIQRGVSPRRLVAAGYGEFQPLEEAAAPAAPGEDLLRRNRRIELKLTNR